MNSGGLDISPAAFKCYAFYAGLLAIKLFAMSGITGFNRFRKKVFTSPEDLSLLPGKDTKVKLDDPDVERTRRAHLNDLENVVPFFAIGFLYCCTHPDVATANFVFKIFTLCRYVYTVVYAIYPVPQPTRVIAFSVAYWINIYMAVKIALYFA